MKLKKLFKTTISICLLFTLFSCSGSNKELEKLAHKEFYGTSGGQIVIIFKKGERILFFSGKPVIRPNTEVEIDKIDDHYEKSQPKEFKNPKIKNKNGKKYLTADDFPYKLEIVGEDKIKDVEDNYEYNYINLWK